MLTSAVKINFDIVEQNNFHDEGLVFRILAGAIMGIASEVNKQEQITQLQQQYGDIEQQYNQLEKQADGYSRVISSCLEGYGG